MSVRFAKLLRSHRRDDDLVKWKDLVIQEERHRPETIHVVMTLFEHQMNQNQFEKMNQTLLDVKALHLANDRLVRDSESYVSARDQISDSASQLQSVLAKLGPIQAGVTQTAAGKSRNPAEVTAL